MNKQQLIDAVIEDLKKGFAVGDYTVLDELLHFIPKKKLIHSLPEEQWNDIPVTQNVLAKVQDECYDIYEKSGGYSKVFDHVARQQKLKNPNYMSVKEEHCEGCDNDMPSLNHSCLICGQTTVPESKL